jgi:hypothetical protein
MNRHSNQDSDGHTVLTSEPAPNQLLLLSMNRYSDGNHITADDAIINRSTEEQITKASTWAGAVAGFAEHLVISSPSLHPYLERSSGVP